jgi:hypothetical protein
MILHKYCNNFGLDTLINLEMKANIPSGFNDPFEFLPKSIGKWNLTQSKNLLMKKNFNDGIFQELRKLGILMNKKEFKIKLKKDINTFAKLLSNKFSEEHIWNMILRMRDKADEITRIICFSSEETDEMEQILLWSHYTDKHCGIRFHFDTELLVESDDKLEKINYSLVRPTFDSTLEPTSIQFQNQLMESFRTKSKVWEYEKEYRLFVFPTKCCSKIIKNEKMFFLKFNPKSLVRVDLGVNSTKPTEQVILTEINKNEKSHIKVFRAKINSEKYKLDCIKIN